MVVTLVNSRTPYKNRSPAKKMRSLKRLISFLCRKMSQPRLPSPLSIHPQMQLSFLPGEPKKNLSISQVNAISILQECPTPSQHSLSNTKEKSLTLNDLMSYCNKASTLSSPKRIIQEQEHKQDMKKFKSILGSFMRFPLFHICVCVCVRIDIHKSEILVLLYTYLLVIISLELLSTRIIHPLLWVIRICDTENTEKDFNIRHYFQ